MCHYSNEIVALFRLGEKAGEQIRVAVGDVGIGEKDVFGVFGDGCHRLLQGPELAFPTNWPRLDWNYRVGSGLPGYGSGGIGALVIGNGNVEAEGAFLQAQGRDGLGHDFGFVAGRNDDGDGGLRSGFQVGAGQAFAQKPEHSAE